MSEISEVFEGIGLLQRECSVHTDPAVHPKVYPPRRVPVALQDKLETELERMECLNIIQKVRAQPMGELSSSSRKAQWQTTGLSWPKIRRPHYPMKTLEYVLPQLD